MSATAGRSRAGWRRTMRLELGQSLGRPAQLEQGLGAVLDGGRAQLGEPDRLGRANSSSANSASASPCHRASAASRSASAPAWSPAAAAARAAAARAPRTRPRRAVAAVRVRLYPGGRCRSGAAARARRAAARRRRAGRSSAAGRGRPPTARRPAGRPGPPRRRRRSSTASSVRGFGPPTATGPSASSTCTGPRIRKRTCPRCRRARRASGLQRARPTVAAARDGGPDADHDPRG